MVPATANKCLFYWLWEDNETYMALATYNILFSSSNPVLYHRLQATLDMYFAYTTSTASVLHFLNYRIIQSDFGTSVDQYNHLRQSILHSFFLNTPVVPFQSNPFPLEASFGMELFTATPLSEDEINELIVKHNGTHSHWTGTLLHIASKSRANLSYLSDNAYGILLSYVRV